MSIGEKIISYLSYFGFSNEELELVSKLFKNPENQILDSKLVEYFYGSTENLSSSERKSLERQIRKTLTKLEQYGLVKCVRSYENGLVVWKTVNTLDVLSVRVKREIENLRNKIEKYEYFKIFQCPSCGSEYHMSEAFNTGFLCPSCGVTLEECNSKKISEIERKIQELEELLVALSKRVE